MIENTVRNKALAVFPGSTSACLPPRPPTPQPPLVETEVGREGSADTDGGIHVFPGPDFVETSAVALSPKGS